MDPTLTVSLGARSYPVYIGDFGGIGLQDALRERLGPRPLALVTNTTIARLYAAQVKSWRAVPGCAVCVIPDGERYKTLVTWRRLLDELLAAKLDRRACVIALGGGVVGDIAGFAAASVLRGVDYVQAPTTLLAMVDSSVGGKTGVNHVTGKNMVGAFHQPRLVWIDMSYLKTLPPREFAAGYAELCKNAFIGGREMFDFVRANHERMLAADPTALAEGIERSVRVKASVVERDEREESGVRALLNFGHTFAHALERHFRYRGVLHGEAVLWGIACACELGRRLGTIPKSAAGDYDRILAKLPLPRLPSPPRPEALYDAMGTDKKVRAGKLRFVVPGVPGESTVRDGVPREDVVGSMESVLRRTPSR